METKEAVLSDGGRSDGVQVLQLDLSDIEALPEKAQKALDFYGQVDVLVNNGGVGSRNSVLETNIAVDQQVMKVNYFGAVALTKGIGCLAVQYSLYIRQSVFVYQHFFHTWLTEAVGTWLLSAVYRARSLFRFDHHVISQYSSGDCNINISAVIDSASKHALEAFFESVRSEVAQRGVHVTLVCPGYINTQLSVNAVTGDGTQYGGISQMCGNFTMTM